MTRFVLTAGFFLMTVIPVSGQKLSMPSSAPGIAAVITPPPPAVPGTKAENPNSAISASAILPNASALSETAFFQAIVEGRQSRIKAYLDGGGKADAVDPSGYTALMLAIDCMRRQIAQGLIAAGANVNFQARDGQTPLNLAIEMGSPGIVQDLLKAGADAKGSGRFIPLQNALKMGHRGIIQMLLTAGADPNNLGTSKIAVSALDQALNIGSASLAGILAKAGANLNSQSRTGDTALMNAALMNHPAMVKTLLSAGADSTVRNLQGLTAQDIAAGTNSSAVKAVFQTKSP